MEPQERSVCGVASARPRLADIEADLAIAGAQWAAWDDFVATFETIADRLEQLDEEASNRFADHPPSLASAVDEQLRILSAKLDGARKLKLKTDRLYGKLSARQRERADRLLPPVCSELATAWPAR